MTLHNTLLIYMIFMYQLKPQKGSDFVIQGTVLSIDQIDTAIP